MKHFSVNRVTEQRQTNKNLESVSWLACVLWRWNQPVLGSLLNSAIALIWLVSYEIRNYLSARHTTIRHYRPCAMAEGGDMFIQHSNVVTNPFTLANPGICLFVCVKL